MRIVRTLWGDYSNFNLEIPETPLFNELVLTFETKNYDFLKSLGYDVLKVSESLRVDDFFLNKLVLLNSICKEEDFLFLDWDVKVDLPEKLTELTSYRQYNVPLYSYPPNYYTDVKTSKVNNGWFLNHKYWMYKLGVWKLEDASFILPCFCCFTNIKSETIIPELLHIGNIMNFNSCSEEFSFFYFLKNNSIVNSLDEYLEKVEPLFMYGRENDYVHNFLDYSHNTLNTYIEKKMKKTPILTHI
jgi:hypothetical protein